MQGHRQKAPGTQQRVLGGICPEWSRGHLTCSGSGERPWWEQHPEDTPWGLLFLEKSCEGRALGGDLTQLPPRGAGGRRRTRLTVSPPSETQ